MFFILSKVLLLFLMPLTWIFTLFLWGLLTRNLVRRKRLLILTFILLYLFSNSYIINQLLLRWEPSPTPIQKLDQYDLGIVLTGVTNKGKSPHDRAYFSHGADRVLHTVQLYKLGKIKKILISGGSGSLSEKTILEADELQKVFLICGVSAHDLIIENKSRNTRENALFSAKLLKNQFPNQSYLLITSAFHMRRAKACFDKVGIKTDPFPVDYYTFDSLQFFYELLPSSDSFTKWNLYLKEIGGMITYRIAGYI